MATRPRAKSNLTGFVPDRPRCQPASAGVLVYEPQSGDGFTSPQSVALRASGCCAGNLTEPDFSFQAAWAIRRFSKLRAIRMPTRLWSPLWGDDKSD